MSLTFSAVSPEGRRRLAIRLSDADLTQLMRGRTLQITCNAAVISVDVILLPTANAESEFLAAELGRGGASS